MDHHQYLAGDKDVKWGWYLRIKVEIDVNKPSVNGLNFCAQLFPQYNLCDYEWWIKSSESIWK